MNKLMFRRWLLHGSDYKTACAKTIQVCLGHGIPIDVVDLDGDSSLLTSAARNPSQQYVVVELLKQGADPNFASRSTRLTPLAACGRRNWDQEDNATMVATLIGAERTSRRETQTT